jgi:hypothetical protein
MTVPRHAGDGALSDQMYCSPVAKAGSPDFTAATKEAKAAVVTISAGPWGSLLSRTGTTPVMNPGAASMQSPPVVPL